MNVPEHLRYTRDHEWAESDDNRIRIGITDYAQDALGDVVFVQIPEVGSNVQAGMPFAEVESTKSVSDVYSPVTGVVVEANGDLAEEPQRINEDPYGSGWICVIERAEDGDEAVLLDSTGYRSLVGDAPSTDD